MSERISSREIHVLLPSQIIEKKRDGQENTREEIETLLGGFLQGKIKDYQVSSWLMAVCLNGLSRTELKDLTELMWKSGKTFPRAERSDFWIDKHSTGGVGDKTSLLLVPLITAVVERKLGGGSVRIPMVSGRGLGHSGGTLDKLDSIPGFSSAMDIPTAMDHLQRHGFIMMGQTQDIAPLDRLLYALRDVTGTVESIPLIVSSIMSKKLSENLDGIVFDVKTGQGAFMTTEKKSKSLAQELVKVAKSQGISATAIITTMDEPLGTSVGNFLEVEECFDYLAGAHRDRGLHEVTLELASHMLRIASRGKFSLPQAKKYCEEELTRARAQELFQNMFAFQGGEWNKFEELKKKRETKTYRFDIEAPKKGWVQEIKAKETGLLLIDLGGGRKTKEDKIDPFVGFKFHKKVGDAVQKGESLVTVYCRPGSDVSSFQKMAQGVFRLSSKPVKKTRWVVSRVS